jgi:aspartate racemase
MRTLGLIGGMSWESSAGYYRRINQGVRDRLGPLRSAEIVMASVDFGPVEQAMREGRWDDVEAVLVRAATRLEAAGAQGIVLCTNTMHRLAGPLASAVRVPLLHIADPIGCAAAAAGVKTVGLLGTATTMEEDFLSGRLEALHGLRVLVPPAPARAVVHRVIFEELCAGIVREPSREFYLGAIRDLAGRGAQAVVLGCTEIGLLVEPAHTDVPLMDTTALHAAAAVDFALAPHA